MGVAATVRCATTVLVGLLFLFPLTATAAQLHVSSYRGRPIVIDAAVMFHTLAADMFGEADGTTYVHTGDIPAMWLRDSSAQMLPYVRLVRHRPVLRGWIRGVIERNARNVIVDPYANAFTAAYRVWERKWEVDSLAYPIVLAYTYFIATNDRSIFTPRLHEALRRTIDTYACEQEHDKCSPYRFASLPNLGGGFATSGTGFIWTAFRASDDPARLPYNIPEQMFASVALRDLAFLASEEFEDRDLALRADLMAETLQHAIGRLGVVYDFRFGWIYAYEVDGRGNAVRMDDANIPSLLADPYFGFEPSDSPLYERTRSFVLSVDNPTFARGTYASGVGSPHTPAGWIWPLSIIARALTSLDPGETLEAIATLSSTNSETGLIHESFDPSDYRRFTREEFGWANALYAELLFRSAADFPALRTHPRPPFDFIEDPPTPAVVTTLQAVDNAAAMLADFDRVVPLTDPPRSSLSRCTDC
jgi:meiotically up-regulated gene 157 (Mug157) protein